MNREPNRSGTGRLRTGTNRTANYFYANRMGTNRTANYSYANRMEPNRFHILICFCQLPGVPKMIFANRKSNWKDESTVMNGFLRNIICQSAAGIANDQCWLLLLLLLLLLKLLKLLLLLLLLLLTTVAITIYCCYHHHYCCILYYYLYY